MAEALPENNGRPVFEPTTQGMQDYAQFIDEYHGGGGGGGSDNYNDLTNKPKLNGVTLQGDVKLSQAGGASIYAAEVLATIPASPTAKQTVMYVGESDATYTKGHIYRYSGTAWVEIYAPAEGGEVESIPLEDIDTLFE